MTRMCTGAAGAMSQNAYAKSSSYTALDGICGTHGGNIHTDRMKMVALHSCNWSANTTHEANRTAKKLAVIETTSFANTRSNTVRLGTLGTAGTEDENSALRSATGAVRANGASRAADKASPANIDLC